MDKAQAQRVVPRIFSSVFFADPESFQQPLPDEKIQRTFNNVTFSSKREEINNVVKMDLTVTSHRIYFTAPSNKALGFQLLFSDLASENALTFNKKMMLFGGIKKIYLFRKDEKKISLQSDCQDQIYQLLEAMIKEKAWEKSQLKAALEAKTVVSSSYRGVADIKQQEREKVMQIGKNIQSTFETSKKMSGSEAFELMFKQKDTLKSISQYIQQTLRLSNTQKESTEMDNILAQLGYLKVLSKDEEGEQFYEKVAQQIWEICQKALPESGGMISLLDLHYLMNTKRATLLLSAQDILEACKHFKRLRVPIRVVEYPGNIKVIEQTNFDFEKDFAETIGKCLSYTEGHTVETLSRKLRLRPHLVRVKLKKALERGKVILDDRIEGQRYFKNMILEFE